jgi:hypothetical protein
MIAERRKKFYKLVLLGLTQIIAMSIIKERKRSYYGGSNGKI